MSVNNNIIYYQHVYTIVTVQEIIKYKKKSDSRCWVICSRCWVICFSCFSSLVFMKLPVLENAASGSGQLENEPSAIQTRVTSIKVIYYGYLFI